jgi:hypothetical protein
MAPDVFARLRIYYPNREEIFIKINNILKLLLSTDVLVDDYGRISFISTSTDHHHLGSNIYFATA